jgi:hypothetical protein
MVTGVFNYYLKYYGALHLLEHLNHVIFVEMQLKKTKVHSTEILFSITKDRKGFN